MVQYSIIFFFIADILVTYKRKLLQDWKFHVLVHIIHRNSMADGTEEKEGPTVYLLKNCLDMISRTIRLKWFIPKKSRKHVEKA